MPAKSPIQFDFSKKAGPSLLDQTPEQIEAERRRQAVANTEAYHAAVADAQQERNKRIRNILNNNTLHYDPKLIGKLQAKINRTANRYNLRERLKDISAADPETGKPYTCPFDCTKVVVKFFRENGVPEEEIQPILDADQAIWDDCERRTVIDDGKAPVEGTPNSE